jgi:hypothetical protein
MKQAFFLLLIILLVSCSSETKKDQKSNIKKFENFLGKEKSNVLNQQVVWFENFLLHQFGGVSIEEAYKVFLKTLSEDRWEEIDWNYDSINKKQLDELSESSGLRKEIWLLPDSVWIDEKTIHTSYKYMFNGYNTGSTSEFSCRYCSADELDSLLISELRNYKFNYSGEFIRGLEIVLDGHFFIKSYLEEKKELNALGPSVIADWMLRANLDFSNYFIKRIIIAELLPHRPASK